MIVAVTGAVPAFTAVKDAMSPEPLAARPIDGVLFVQLYTTVPPVAGLLKLTAVVGAALQIVWLLITFTVAVGFTVMVNVLAVPGQELPLV